MSRALILAGSGCGPDLFANEQPQAPRRAVAVMRHRVEVTGALGPRGDPSGVGERFQMPAHGGLRELENAAQLGDGQLMPIEEQQNSAARRVGESSEMIEDRRRASIHPYSRMKG